MEKDYNQYYNKHIECDFCGQMTRGRIWSEDPYKIKCGSCHHILMDLEKSVQENPISVSKYTATSGVDT